MAVSINGLLNLPIYKDNVKLLSKSGENNRVRYLTVMEAPDFHVSSLSKEVLILTTLSSHHDSIDDINKIVESLCKANVSGIMIKLGRFIDKVDVSTIEIADKYGVALLTLSSNTYFTNILNDSFMLLSGDKLQTIEKLNEVNEELMKAIASSRPTKELLRIIDNSIGSRSYLEDNKGAIISEYNDSSELEEVVSIINRLKTIRSLGNTEHLFQQRDNMIAYICENEYGIDGYYCMVFDNIAAKPVIMYAQAFSRLLSIRLVQMDIEENVKRQMISSIMSEILFNEHRDETVISDRLKTLNFKPYDYHLLLLIETSDKKHINHLYNAATNEFKSYFASSFVFRQEDTLVVLLSEKKGVSKEKQLYKVEDVVTNLRQTNKNISFNVSCSAISEKLKGINNRYEQAKMAMRFGKNSNEKNSVYYYDNYIEMGLISSCLDSSTSDIFFKKIIDPISKSDESYNSELWQTIDACFKTNSLKEAADKLCIHISTLRYRISKIDILTGYNYINNDDRMTLYLAYMLYKAKGKKIGE